MAWKDAVRVLEGMGFETPGPALCFGVWNGWGLVVRSVQIGVTEAVFAARTPPDADAKKCAKAAARACRERGWSFWLQEDGLLAFRFPSSKGAQIGEALRALDFALRENGVVPADACALTGAPHPDSFCLLPGKALLGYRPVDAAALKRQGEETRKKAADNEAAGSYVSGTAGAFLGMLAGVVPNWLLLVFANRIVAGLFALVPIASMWGYRKAGGKMTGGAVAVTVAMGVLAVPALMWATLATVLVKDEGVPLGEALAGAAAGLANPKILELMEPGKLLLFTGLGLWISWTMLRNMTNSATLLAAEARLKSLRPRR